ncbi:hypothetical protein O6H91_11G067900 [Diphasiastrum complanatum]|uniref:Uncharacterized protein n=2 Tax=Diphasiastrum complanatum TaxID=34168 RepID=A0ACC2CA56_DIPCM|nr:hypothetical protein O6H91_11G067900 [Diphasiastrum complanatum]KAJ7538893.1 hypothetical protein O6H91_11G067900 [Diphasiastrum complanatum]
MQSSVRAVEAYRRSRLIDSATLDEDKVTPVYRLDEICDLLIASPADIVKEVVEFIFKRLEHKSPIVKQKTLRLIKYSVGKSGSEFRREMQRQSGAIRNLFHYKGQVDPLKGDALNKAVRDTAHEAITAIFASDERTSSMEDVSKRIQGFGSTNFDASLEDRDKRTILGEVMSFGSQSIKQGLSKISNHYRGSATGTGSHSIGSYQAPNLRRSISDRDNFDRYRESYFESRSSEHLHYKTGQASTGTEYLSSDFDDSRAGAHEISDSVPGGTQPSQAETLVDKVAAVGGVRLQPSRDTLQNFLLEAQKLDPVVLQQALEAKLQAHSWQVRFKVLCLLEAILRQKENERFDIVAGMFEDNSTAVANCLEFPHASLKDKAKKVLNMLGAGSKEEREQAEEPKEAAVSAVQVELPDLIDTTEPGFENTDGLSNYTVTESLESTLVQADLLDHEQHSIAPEVTHNTFGGDPFADMSLHTAQVANGSRVNGDLFSGLSMEDDKVLDKKSTDFSARDESSLFEGLSISTNEQASVRPKEGTGSLIDLMDSLSTSDPSIHHQIGLEQMHSASAKSNSAQQPVPPIPFLNSHGGFANNISRPPEPPFVPSQVPSFVSSGVLQTPVMYANPSMLMPTGIVGVPPSSIYMQHVFAQHNFGFPLAGAPFNQQHVMAGLPAISRSGMVAQQQSGGNGLQGSYGHGGFDTTFTDGFDFPKNSAPRYTMENSKKEETKAFDFISDHVSAARGPKK